MYLIITYVDFRSQRKGSRRTVVPRALRWMLYLYACVSWLSSGFVPKIVKPSLSPLIFDNSILQLAIHTSAFSSFSMQDSFNAKKNYPSANKWTFAVLDGSPYRFPFFSWFTTVISHPISCYIEWWSSNWMEGEELTECLEDERSLFMLRSWYPRISATACPITSMSSSSPYSSS